MKLLYLDCTAGVAGDMLLGALVDAGADQAAVLEALEGLDLNGWGLRFETTTRAGIRATRAIVEASEERTERSYADIASLLERSGLDPAVRDLAARSFLALAKAEARVHAVCVEKVHFHEVGAIDSIIDTVGACAALISLGPDQVVSSPIATGSGVIETRHGQMPVPAPAVLELLAGVPVFERAEGELTTPTGAALVTTFADRFDEMPAMTLRATGYGAGARDAAHPNVVRALLGDVVAEHDQPATAILAETNIDDMNPELIPHVVQSLLAAGAQDAWTTPIVMKKGRPAITLSVLFASEAEDRVLDVIYRETTTFGLRLIPVRKEELARAWIEVEVAGHPVKVKVARRGGEIITVAPEFEDSAAAARATGMALKDVYAAASATARVRLETLEERAP